MFCNSSPSRAPRRCTGIHSSRITPSLTYNTVDNPVNPTHGKSLFTSFALEGGPIGGNVNSITQNCGIQVFSPELSPAQCDCDALAGRVYNRIQRQSRRSVQPVLSGRRRHTCADLMIRTVSPVVFIPQRTTTPFTILGSDSPQWERTIRLPRTISIPTLSYQTSFPGGDTQGVANLEYRIPIAPHVSASLFADVGATGALRHDQLQLNSTDLTSLQAQFPNTSFGRSHLPFQPGTNFKLRSTVGVELVVQLPIVQAPFRIYWAI